MDRERGDQRPELFYTPGELFTGYAKVLVLRGELSFIEYKDGLREVFSLNPQVLFEDETTIQKVTYCPPFSEEGEARGHTVSVEYRPDEFGLLQTLTIAFDEQRSAQVTVDFVNPTPIQRVAEQSFFGESVTDEGETADYLHFLMLLDTSADTDQLLELANLLRQLEGIGRTPTS